MFEKAKPTLKEWEADIEIYYTLTFAQDEEGETEEDVRNWLRSDDGKNFIREEVSNHLKLTGWPTTGTIDVDEIRLKEREL